MDFRKEGTAMSYRVLKRMADDALMRIAERSRKRNGAGMNRMPTKKMLFWPFYRIISATVWRLP